MSLWRQQSGVTLIELIVAIIIIAIGFVAVSQLFGQAAMSSADPMIKHQAVAIAESYIEEMLLLPFDEDEASGEAEGVLGPDTGETSRALFDDVNDYHGWVDTGITNLNGTAVSGLNNFNVAVTVVTDNSYDNTIPLAESVLITVTVTSDVDPNLRMPLSGYRLKFPDPAP
ncbi:MAG: prepilin-type N-terminal cleavage/methylation domain-containing protein [Candidatus Polarisedimenticolaceae bacterium]|nr:prepilin-type N-terminal cleavage/methylation domain-containing protein [Candidatus Polarisedimenticolaceae bacterium]